MSLAGVLILAVPAISEAFGLPPRSRGMLGGVFLMYGAFGGVSFAFLRQSRSARVKADLEPLYARRRVLLRLSGQPSSPSASEPSYFDRLVTINVENLAAYYTLVKVQTDKSFTTSVAAGIVGFAFVLAGLMIAFSDVRNSDRVAYISTGAGIVTEFIASVFFYLYNRTVRQMKGYHDSLLSVQNVLVSFKLVGDIKTDDAEKVKMVGQMLSYLMGKKLEAIGGTAVEFQPKA
jgi:hypothetical protein